MGPGRNLAFGRLTVERDHFNRSRSPVMTMKRFRREAKRPGHVQLAARGYVPSAASGLRRRVAADGHRRSKLSTPAKAPAKRVAFTASHADGGATVASLAPATVCASTADRVC